MSGPCPSLQGHALVQKATFSNNNTGEYSYTCKTDKIAVAKKKVQGKMRIGAQICAQQGGWNFNPEMHCQIFLIPGE